MIGIQNSQCGIQNIRLAWIPLHRAIINSEANTLHFLKLNCHLISLITVSRQKLQTLTVSRLQTWKNIDRLPPS